MPFSPGQGLSPGDSSWLCSHFMPCIPQTCPGSLTCLLCGQASQPGCQPGTGIHPSRQPVRHPSIHSYMEQLTFCTTLAQNKASLWGTVVGFVPPSLMPHIPQTCPGSPLKAQGTGRDTGLSTPSFPFLFLILSLF